jgi:hypothetical protein
MWTPRILRDASDAEGRENDSGSQSSSRTTAPELLLAAPGCSKLLLGYSWLLLAVPGLLPAAPGLLQAAPGCSWLLLAFQKRFLSPDPAFLDATDRERC